MSLTHVYHFGRGHWRMGRRYVGTLYSVPFSCEPKMALKLKLCIIAQSSASSSCALTVVSGHLSLRLDVQKLRPPSKHGEATHKSSSPHPRTCRWEHNCPTGLRVRTFQVNLAPSCQATLSHPEHPCWDIRNHDVEGLAL